ncbi:MAG: hypothetical protein CMJ14_06335 [Pelagibacterales bacterium]|nr:hypothetical protein [Pelagibacterales bacterium]|tara:strand:+ start:121 stop:324 length:204 start_codon:yes stop_codon:yes gene_type:complete
MLKSFISKFVFLFFCAIVILFSLANPDYVSLGIWPLERRVDVPLYFMVIIVFTIGFLLGNIFRLLKK